MKRVCIFALLGLAACGPGSAADRPLIAGERHAAAHAVVALAFQPSAIAANTLGDATLIAGAGTAAWVSFGSAEVVDIAIDGTARSVASTGPDSGVVVSDSIQRIEGPTASEHAAGTSLRDMAPHLAAAADASSVWLAGHEIARAHDAAIDRVRIRGAWGSATALAIASADLAWVAHGDSLYSVRIGDPAQITEVRELGIGEISALTIDRQDLIAGGTEGLALRDSAGNWSLRRSDPVTALAGKWAIIGDALAARSEDENEDGYLRVDSAENAIALGTDSLERAIIARGEQIERYDLIDRDSPNPPQQPKSFARDILPWAQTGCNCHFTGNTAMADLTTADAWRQRATIILRRVVEQQPPVMPPPEVTTRPTAEQRELLRSWIEGTRDD